ncbi:putative YAP-binding/ALF4/Glomulin [Septoria linicola]|nr:putative YAP-binding/ALF4/Glomulin [Septoria linicola]
MSDEESPLIKALPPASDYLTYLTIIEYNLKPENLPTLHKVLQDETLATNIGWDLVHLLAPLLPESEECLQDVARLGNPREVILKVIESLRLIEYDDVDEADELDVVAGAGDTRKAADSNTFPLKTAAPQDGSTQNQARELPPPLPLPVQQFVALLSMLGILQTRIKTKSPSRFLSTTLQAILSSFSSSQAHREEMIEAIVKLIKAVSGTSRPTLPSRKSSGMLGSNAIAKAQNAADPEGPNVVEYTDDEKALQLKLLQAFITHVLEEYMLNFPAYDDVPGLAWCSRIMEKVHPERTIPESLTMADRFASEQKLNRRIDAIGQLVTLAKDLNLSNEELLTAATTAEKMPESVGDEDDPPSSAAEIPLSRHGSLLLYTARQVSTVLYPKTDTQVGAEPAFELFPKHQDLLKNCLASPEMGQGNLGTEPEALLDTVLALGLLCLERDAIGEPKNDEQFNEYLQVVALLSSNCPNANLRGHAHYLTSTVLRSQPDDEVRLSFIRDTLEHCPFENLKVSAVGWVKGETIEANPQQMPGHEAHTHESSEKSIFARPLALDSLAPHLFPSLQADLITAPISDAWMTLQTNVSFYLASLNLIYLLLSAKHIHQPLEISELWNNNDVAGSFLTPLRDVKKRFFDAMEAGGELADEKSDTAVAELVLLQETIERVEDAVKNLN